ncbi:nuclear antigen LANA [Wood mouse herpesvirus]|uniref:Nuclear antigen LANA n=1 Tax=Wood mouse herpesvirus TaxID=432370 RepID=D0U1R2_9GAMA|nr:nuclear antigen LANA [Wood mouse herpesvirus]ACY41142.1 nuclear antigen LANA [Wood mouse herpesvirus]
MPTSPPTTRNTTSGKTRSGCKRRCYKKPQASMPSKKRRPVKRPAPPPPPSPPGDQDEESLLGESSHTEERPEQSEERQSPPKQPIPPEPSPTTPLKETPTSDPPSPPAPPSTPVPPPQSPSPIPAPPSPDPSSDVDVEGLDEQGGDDGPPPAKKAPSYPRYQKPYNEKSTLPAKYRGMRNHMVIAAPRLFDPERPAPTHFKSAVMFSCTKPYSLTKLHKVLQSKQVVTSTVSCLPFVPGGQPTLVKYFILSFVENKKLAKMLRKVVLTYCAKFHSNIDGTIVKAKPWFPLPGTPTDPEQPSTSAQVSGTTQSPAASPEASTEQPATV